MLIRRIALGLTLVCWLAAGPRCFADVESTAIHTNELSPGPNDGRIAYVVARLLEQNQFLRHPLDDDFSSQFFDRYFETLDPQRLFFLQSDIESFSSLRTRLDDLTLGDHGVGDVHPAYDIFARFLKRLEQRVAYVQSLLKTNKFEFNTDERMIIDRREEPYPRDLAEAKRLWKQRLRYEYLQEILARYDAKKGTNDVTASEKPSDSVQTNSVANAENSSAEKKSGAKPKTEAEEIVEKLSNRYTRTLHMFQEWDNQDVMEVYLTSLAHVYDPHSDYFNKRQADNFAIGMNLSLFGIGAELGFEDGYCVIRKLYPGPAMKSKKLKEGDRIVAVAQGTNKPVDVVEMALTKTVQLIRGPKGSEVRLTIIPAKNPDERKVVSLVRDEIKLEDQEAKARIIELPDGTGKTERLGVIDLPSFYATINPGSTRRFFLGKSADEPTIRSTSADVEKLLETLKKENVAGIILDLRRNGGGSLEEAIKLTGLFIKEGPVVQVKGPDGPPLIEEDPDPGIAYDGPLIVLTSRFSASASEILAGALQDYGRALIVGDISTHGKGTVQNINALRPWVRPATRSATNDPGELKVTIRKFYRAGGTSTQLKGVLPDIVLPSVLNYSKDVGEISLENPLVCDSIPSAQFDKLNMVAPYLPELLRRSNQRIATNQDYVYIRQDIAEFRKEQAENTISLNEQVRLKKQEELDARDKQREEERKSRPPSDIKTWDMTLENLNSPQLPPPVGTNTESLKVTSTTGTNALETATNQLASADDSAADSDDDKAVAVDPPLYQAERILEDYIALLSRDGVVANH